MQNAEKINFLEKELGRLLEWVKTVEGRITFILPLSTAMLTFLAVLAPEKMASWPLHTGIFSALAAIFLISAIICTAFASFPRTSGPLSVIYFGGIAARERNQYRIAVSSLTEDEYIEDLINQCYVNAQIASKKYYWIQKSLICLFISSLPWFISIYCLYEANG